MISSKTKLAIIAGRGQLPLDAAISCQARKKPFVLVGFKGMYDPKQFRGMPVMQIESPGLVDALLGSLREQGVDEVLMIGSWARPSMSALKVDEKGKELRNRLIKSVLGDNGLLRFVREQFEQAGFKVVGTRGLIPNLFMEAGTPTAAIPDEQTLQDIKLGFKYLAHNSEFDVGQAVVVQQGQIIAVEARQGTDKLIKEAQRIKYPGPKPVLVKAMKQGQEDVVDLPTIGPRTIKSVAKAGFAGLAITADTTQVVDKAAVIKACDRYGLFLKVCND